MIDVTLKISKIALYLSLTFSVIYMTHGSLQVMESIITTENSVVLEVRDAKQQALNSLHEGVHLINDRLKSSEKTLNYQAGAITKQLDNRLASFETSGLLVADSYLKEIDQLSTKLDPTIKLINLAAEQSRPYLDCKNNNGCVQQTTVETLQAARAASRDVSRLAFTMNGEIPEITKNVIDISSSIEKTSAAITTSTPIITHNMEKISENIKRITTKRWYDRIISAGLAASPVIYGLIK